MRTESEIFKIILEFAKADPRIRVVILEGSRTNENVPRDDFRDFDVSFGVTEMASFVESDAWLSVFGNRVMMQKPEAMDFFPPEMDWFSYLMLFDDGVKIDLTLVPTSDLDKFLSSDKLMKTLLDKDGLVGRDLMPTDEDYWITSPTPAFFDDVCNEFWLSSTYVAKGLVRNEPLFAAHMMERVVRDQALTMLSWKIGAEHGFDFSLGKHFKFIRSYLTVKEWELLMKTYRMDDLESSWAALRAAQKLFRDASMQVARKFGYRYPDYDAAVTRYINNFMIES